VVASDKLIYWLFQQHAERLQPLVAALLPRMDGYLFSAPVLKEREYRLDGLFLPPAACRPARLAGLDPRSPNGGRFATGRWW
jgi:predicted transposase YdaD